jgi:hypothetical protein
MMISFMPLRVVLDLAALQFDAAPGASAALQL